MMTHVTTEPSLHIQYTDSDTAKLSVPRNADQGHNNVAGWKWSVFARSPTARKQHFVVCFSGTTPEIFLKCFAEFIIESHTNYLLSLPCSSSTMFGEHFKVRKAFVSTTTEHLLQQMKKMFLQMQQIPHRINSPIPVVYVFSGTGSAWTGMCKHLIENNHTFKAAIEDIAVSLRRYVPWSLTKRFAESYDVGDLIFDPVSIFACEVALARLWQELGVEPSAVVGQSLGEVAAAHIAGILPLDEAVKVVFHRSKILSQTEEGKMILVRNLETTKVEAMCSKYKGKLNVSLFHSPVSCSVSGDRKAVDALANEISLHQSEIKIIALDRSRAYHSHHMEVGQQQLVQELNHLKTEDPSVRMISTLSPDYTSQDIRSTKYWGQHLRQPVQYCEAIRTAVSKQNAILLEIAPRPILRAHLKDIFFDRPSVPLCLSSMSYPGTNEDLLESAAVLYEHNINIKWEALIMENTSSPE
ncbi:narbonolide/10-deoxymethynolide synthase PikA2, modules 3 and 4-like [Haliotis rubra]|uniref:narbonolide/10-deoxymethynolide synthase PikA2, modules 3 and 4-like n=1 Tax=Haliotis rubra TaxID=36100 RepID=UPI001EE5351C|nr:narbonolide/10-deoxymethynolide synthase PikA2, modules 3 and 4-like [Haliotis rubra]